MAEKTPVEFKFHKSVAFVSSAGEFVASYALVDEKGVAHAIVDITDFTIKRSMNDSKVSEEVYDAFLTRCRQEASREREQRANQNL